MEAENTIWIEKYRPARLSEIVGQDEIVRRLEAYVKTRNMPHLLFTGSAGVGKTTAAVALAKELFGDSWHLNFRELNASDERGIDVVRNQIKQFARISPLAGAEFKILFLDEADALTPDAQAALRRTMENYAQTCRFILSCNYSSRIIDPIQSRCAIFRFGQLGREAIEKEVRKIAEAEGLEITPEGVEAIVYVAQGDMRRAINALQGASMTGRRIEAETIFSVTATARPEEVEALIGRTERGDFEGAEAMLQELLVGRGIAPHELLNQCYRSIIRRSMDPFRKVEMIGYLGEADFRMSEGANPEIQMKALIANFVLSGRRGG